MYLCIYVSMYLCIYVSMYLCIYVFMYLCIYVSMYLYIYVSMCTSVQVGENSILFPERTNSISILNKNPRNKWKLVRTGFYNQDSSDKYSKRGEGSFPPPPPLHSKFNGKGSNGIGKTTIELQRDYYTS